jgi:protoporphyrin/coproporphyrin ferrochelatase
MAERRRIAVVLFNLGGPDSQDAVRPFLFNLFRDRAILQLPTPFRQLLAGVIALARTKAAKANYAHMGGASPLLKETNDQARALEQALAARLPEAELKVVIAMRYWRPTTEQAARAVEAFAPDEVVLLPLYPQFSATTTGSSLEAWRRSYRGSGRSHTACCYFEDEGLAKAHAARIQECWEKAGRPEPVRLLFSAHGLPERNVLAGDPYQWQVERTCEAIVARLEGTWDWRVCYQSRVGPMKWLGPSTPEEIAEACADGKGVLIDPVAFVSEHVETLVELDRDYAELAAASGCRDYLRARTVGCEPSFIEGLAKTVETALARPGICPQGRRCADGWRGCPLKAGGKA